MFLFDVSMRVLGLVGLHGLVLGFGIAVYSFAGDPPPIPRTLERYALLADSLRIAKGEAREGVQRELRGLQNRTGFTLSSFSTKLQSSTINSGVCMGFYSVLG